jgi:hypothetical protein
MAKLRHPEVQALLIHLLVAMLATVVVARGETASPTDGVERQ